VLEKARIFVADHVCGPFVSSTKMTDPTWEDEFARASLPEPLLCGDLDCSAALVCAECKAVLVLQEHLLEDKFEQGEGKGWSYPLDVFEKEYTCYQVLDDAGADGERERHDLVVAVKEEGKLPSKNGWIENPKAKGQGLQLSECKGWPGRDEDLDYTWFRGYKKRVAHCAQCKAEVAWLFEPDAIYFLAYVAMDASGKGNGNAFGMVPFWGLKVTAVRPRLHAPGAPTSAPAQGHVADGPGCTSCLASDECELPPRPRATVESESDEESETDGVTTAALGDRRQSDHSEKSCVDSPAPAVEPVSTDVRQQLLMSGLLPRLYV
jgi:hypothetical protein